MMAKEMFFESSTGPVFVDCIANELFIYDGPYTVGAASGVPCSYQEIQPLSLEGAVVELVRRLGEEREPGIRGRLTQCIVKTET